jgi:hypothetical protein
MPFSLKDVKLLGYDRTVFHFYIWKEISLEQLGLLLMIGMYVADVLGTRLGYRTLLLRANKVLCFGIE